MIFKNRQVRANKARSKKLALKLKEDMTIIDKHVSTLQDFKEYFENVDLNDPQIDVAVIRRALKAEIKQFINDEDGLSNTIEV